MPTHEVHRPPSAPQAVCAPPSVHTVPLQQPPLQKDALLQALEQTPSLHALPGRQSLRSLQPQAPETHWSPFIPGQNAQVPPSVPHWSCVAPATHIDPLQQPPWH